jgi:hypothetical protein
VWAQVNALPVFPSQSDLEVLLGDEVRALSPASSARIVGSYVSIGFVPLASLLLLGCHSSAFDYDKRMSLLLASAKTRSRYYFEKLIFLAVAVVFVVAVMYVTTLVGRAIAFAGLDTRIAILAEAKALTNIFSFPRVFLVAFSIALEGFLFGTILRSTFWGALLSSLSLAIQLVFVGGAIGLDVPVPANLRRALLGGYFHVDGSIFDPPIPDLGGLVSMYFLGMAVGAVALLAWVLVKARREL